MPLTPLASARVDAEAPLLVLYTSGGSGGGAPRGVLHSAAGFMVYAASSFKRAYGINSFDTVFATSDVGQAMGHTYCVYGPLLLGVASVLYEGSQPAFPDPGRYWRIVDKYCVSIFITSPTALRLLRRFGAAPARSASRASLRVLGSAGEPLNPTAWEWFHDVVGDGRLPLVDAYWTAEASGPMIFTMPFVAGLPPAPPGCSGLPFYGIQPALMDERSGREVTGAGEGVLVIKAAWPGIARGVLRDAKTYEAAFFSPFPGTFYTGDGARREADGSYRLLGRVDDALVVGGTRLGAAEVEAALCSHPLCAEAAVVSCPHALKGNGIYAFVSLIDEAEASEPLRRQLQAAVRRAIGAHAVPDAVQFMPPGDTLPKVRAPRAAHGTNCC